PLHSEERGVLPESESLRLRSRLPRRRPTRVGCGAHGTSKGGTMRTLLRNARLVACAATLLIGGSLALRAQVGVDAELQYQLATLLYDETRYPEALRSFEQAAESTDKSMAVRARKGVVRSALKIAEFKHARTEAERLRADAPADAEALALYADALWSAGM